MKHSIRFSVPFVKPKARPRFGNGRTYTPKETLIAEEAIAHAWREACLEELGETYTIPKGTEVIVNLTFIRPLPKSRPKKIEEEADTFKPDIDNLIKLVLDGLSKGGAWSDDSQVTNLHAAKAHRKRDWEWSEKTLIDVTWEEGE